MDSSLILQQRKIQEMGKLVKFHLRKYEILSLVARCGVGLNPVRGVAAAEMVHTL